MKIHICTNKDFLLFHKSLFIKENVIGMDYHFFYDIPLVKYPQELISQSQYFPYIEEIHLYLDSTFISFVDLIFIMDYLNINLYEKEVILHYYDKNTFKMSLTKMLPYETRQKCSDICRYFCNQKEKYELGLLINCIPNLRIGLMMYNTIQFEKKQFLMILNECLDDSKDIFDAMANFEENYPNYGFSKDYLKKNFEKIMEAKYDGSIKL